MICLDPSRPTERPLGPGARVLIVAELSCNHAGSFQRAHDLIDMAADAGADAIKVQVFDPERLALRRGGPDCPAPAPWQHLTRLQLYGQAQTPLGWLPSLATHARERGLVPIASVFDAADTWHIVTAGGRGHPEWAALKIAAPEWEQRAAILAMRSGESAGQYQGPLFCSVPLDARLPSLPLAENVALLHCVSAYPARCEAMRLQRILELRRIQRVVGLSDHSVCEATAIAAVALGIDLLEVHIMLDEKRYDELPLDAGHSWRPDGFARLCRAVRHAEASL